MSDWSKMAVILMVLLSHMIDCDKVTLLATLWAKRAEAFPNYSIEDIQRNLVDLWFFSVSYLGNLFILMYFYYCLCSFNKYFFLSKRKNWHTKKPDFYDKATLFYKIFF